MRNRDAATVNPASQIIALPRGCLRSGAAFRLTKKSPRAKSTIPANFSALNETVSHKKAWARPNAVRRIEPSCISAQSAPPAIQKVYERPSPILFFTVFSFVFSFSSKRSQPRFSVSDSFDKLSASPQKGPAFLSSRKSLCGNYKLIFNSTKKPPQKSRKDFVLRRQFSRQSFNALQLTCRKQQRRCRRFCRPRG